MKFFRNSRSAADGGIGTPTTVNQHTLKLFGLSLENEQPMFRNVSVRMLSFPHYEEEKMRHLDRLNDLDLLPSYRNQMIQLRRDIWSGITPKRFNGHTMTGESN
jgi:hypothetical protein